MAEEIKTESTNEAPALKKNPLGKEKKLKPITTKTVVMYWIVAVISVVLVVLRFALR